MKNLFITQCREGHSRHQCSQSEILKILNVKYESYFIVFKLYQSHKAGDIVIENNITIALSYLGGGRGVAVLVGHRGEKQSARVDGYEMNGRIPSLIVSVSVHERPVSSSKQSRLR